MVTACGHTSIRGFLLQPQPRQHTSSDQLLTEDGLAGMVEDVIGYELSIAEMTTIPTAEAASRPATTTVTPTMRCAFLDRAQTAGLIEFFISTLMLFRLTCPEEGLDVCPTRLSGIHKTPRLGAPTGR
jgi:hypothetical protein